MELQEIKSALDTATAELKSAMTEAKNGSVEAKQLATELKTSVDTLTAEMKSRMDELEAKQNRPTMTSQIVSKTLGQMFVDSDAFVEFGKKGFRGESQSYEAKDITGAAASAGGLIPEFRNPTVFMTPDRPVFIRQLVNRSPVAGDSVTIMRENVFTNNAGPQFDDNETPKNQLVNKNKSNITYSQEVYAVTTMAHYVIAARQVLADAPRLRAMIDNRLPYGLNLKMDAQLLYGTGTNENLKGLLVDAGVQTVGELPQGTDPADIPAAMVDHIRKAITKCQEAEFYNVNGLVLSPQALEQLELAKGTDGHYIKQVDGGRSIWGVPIIVSNALADSDFILGDWTQGATLYEREQISVRASESHANLFVQNGVAILGEERVAFAIELPKAFCKGSFDVAE